MRKAVVAAVLLLAAAVLALPWYLGGQAEAAYRNSLVQLSTTQGMRLVDHRYEQGWFSSRALAEMESEATGADPLRVRIASRVLHGPWPLDALRLMPSSALIESRVEVSLAGSELPALLATTRVELDGSGLADLRIPEVERTAGFGTPGLRMPESRGTMRFGPGFAGFESRYVFPSLELTASDGTAVSIQGVRAESTGTRGAGGIFVGTGELGLSGLRVRHPQGDVEIRGLAARLDATPRDGLMDFRMSYGLDGLTVAGGTYDSAKLVLSVTGLPAEALADLRRTAAELPPEPLTGAAPGSAARQLLPHYLPALLAPNPKVAIEHLEVGTPSGRIAARLSLGTSGMTREVIERPGAWLSHLVGEADLRLPKPLFLELLTHWHRDRALTDLRKRDPELTAVPAALEPDIADAARVQLDTLLRDGWAFEQSGQVESNLRLADAMLTINGKTFPLTGLALP